ncbi:MAG: F0F1 ATP synthase subunit A [Betaproteobacteria bacterium]|nr:F0F1 ATP synthase subunit A [Betaproteobacteria bacterium]
MEEAAATQGTTAGEYINHHMVHFNSIGKAQTDIFDLSVINFDTVFFSLALGLLTIFLLARAARRATSGVPGRCQAAVEILVEMVADQAKSMIHSEQSRRFVAPLALTVFVWIFLMNAMDLLPVDLLPWLWAGAYKVAGADPSHAYMRVLPTADLNGAMGLSISVLLICIWYNIKIKGFGGWMHELFSAPFGAHWALAPFNFAMQIIEFVAKTFSHGMRLFGNMFAGELIFMLIALLGGMAALSAGGLLLVLGHIIAGTAWAIFHILIITLQAFVFMMLTLVYIGQAHESH